MYKFSLLDKIALVLVLIGALNWGLIGLFNLDLVRLLFGFFPNQILIRIVYLLIGASAVDLIISVFKMKKSAE